MSLGIYLHRETFYFIDTSNNQNVKVIKSRDTIITQDKLNLLPNIVQNVDDKAFHKLSEKGLA